jgi:hypothetical protein
VAHPAQSQFDLILLQFAICSFYLRESAKVLALGDTPNSFASLRAGSNGDSANGPAFDYSRRR